MATSVIDSPVFRDLFTEPRVRKIWSDSGRTEQYLAVEAALSEVQGRLGIIPADAAKKIASVCLLEKIDMVRLADETAEIGYPVLPLVHQIQSLAGDAGDWCHWGATTQDITDTATVLQIKASLDVVADLLERCIAAASGLARAHRDLPMVGRSNLQQAVPITFGFKMARLAACLLRHRERLAELRPRIEVLEFGGACGTLASLGDRGLDVQKVLADTLGLARPPITWHTDRDSIAETACFLGLVTGTLSKFATDLKTMMMTEVNEAAEPFVLNRGSSSTMPQKRNPISCCYITACAASVRQSTAALLGSMDADHERSTGPWEIEWIELPRIFSLASGALSQAAFVLEGLEVNGDRMAANLGITKGLIMSEAVMMALAPKIGRGQAHDMLYKVCRAALEQNRSLAEMLKADDAVTEQLSHRQIDHLTDPARYLGCAGEMIDAVLAHSTTSDHDPITTLAENLDEGSPSRAIADS
ncbi:adenylosuccinate lyase family protein (plasmid) [Komagataeibacter oboediens]|uniref:class-II fumarase/aspartase family protein n=1 Tax=Komagataeibacter oboediens TaxID=65958 RepID=UPI001AEEFECD|nr:adenylosuccinate lyase family protein [Komagataeibacter oboediens]WEQ50905.1 adenylosuccinate lyase family protein [Komagataeibacter oboediens]